jgi:hypothetical protein
VRSNALRPTHRLGLWSRIEEATEVGFLGTRNIETESNFIAAKSPASMEKPMAVNQYRHYH